MSNISNYLWWWRDVVDILLVSFIIYRVILIIRGTRAMQMLAGIIVLTVIYFGAKSLELLTLYWLLRTFLSSIFLIIIIVFQQDLRRALTQVGKATFHKPQSDDLHTLDVVVMTAQHLAEKQLGALIVIERETGLKDYIESGHKIDAKLTRELLLTIFIPSSPLHDGGVIIHKGRIQTAGCLLPLTRNPYISRRYGTRHRAAIGLSEETDAVIVVVSEETRAISLVQNGSIATMQDATALKNRLETILIPEESQPQLWKNWFKR